MNTKIKIPDNSIDLINVLFTQLEITYHNQFHKAFPDSDSLKLAKQLWLKKLSLFEKLIPKNSKTLLEPQLDETP